MKEYAKDFYMSPAWRHTREAYVKKMKGLCELCLAKGIYKAGDIVHHKIHITPENVGDPSITLSFDNLCLVCRDHHAELHSNKEGARFIFDENGRLILPG